MKKEINDYIFILIGSLLYAFGTVLFIFPHSLLLGGTSGISVILEAYLPFSPGTILMVINFALLLLAFVVLGKGVGIKTLVGSALTTLFVGCVEKVFCFEYPIISNAFISAIAGALIIAVASGVMFYVGSNSGGTDIIALIVKKYSKINIGKALFITDILIVVIGGLLSGIMVLISSFLGLFIKTFGIDIVIGMVNRAKIRKEAEK